MRTTRAAVLREMGAAAPYAESRPLEIREVELAPPGAGEVMVRVRAAGLCHSDLSVINGSRPRVMPMVLGHEAAGEVVEVGPVEPLYWGSALPAVTHTVAPAPVWGSGYAAPLATHGVLPLVPCQVVEAGPVQWFF